MENQEQVWNSIADFWNKYRIKKSFELDAFVENKKGNLLDLCCGSGRNFVKKFGLKIYGVDFSEKMLEYAEDKIKKESINAVLVKSESSQIPFLENFFDSAIFIAALHCIPSEEKREETLKELFRVLKSGSKAMITVWSKNHKKVKKYYKGIKDNLIPWKKEGKVYERYYYIYDKKELEDLLKKVGFKIINSKEKDNVVFIVEKD